jgi:hypothetical protein
MSKVILYHGTSGDEFTHFDESSIGRGGDANSALGVHCTEHPAVAAGYADLGTSSDKPQKSRILILEVDLSRVKLTNSPVDFYGWSDQLRKTRTHADYSSLRVRLQSAGFQALVTDQIGEDDGTWVIFDPSNIQIIGTMSFEEGFEADSQSKYDDVVMDWSGELFVDVSTLSFSSR